MVFSKDKVLVFAEILAGKSITLLLSESSSEPQVNNTVQINSLNKFLEEKASITINGVSLTISKVSKDNFDLNIIPHTLKLTNLKNLKTNDIVNVELDIFGKYIYKYNH